MKRYVVSQGSLEMAHRSPQSGLVWNIQSQQTKPTDVGKSGIHIEPIHEDKTADTYNPNHPQIVRFYRKWGKQE